MRLNPSPDRPRTLAISALTRNSNSLAAQDSLDFLSNVTILAAHELRPLLQYRHAAAEAAVGLSQLEAYVAAAEHDEVRRQVVELESLDIREWSGLFQPGNLGNCRVRPDIDEDIIAGEHTDAAVIQQHLDRVWRDKPTRTHD